MSDSPENPVVLGLDFGLRRIGVAIGQTLTGEARALTTIDSREGRPDLDALEGIIEAWRPARIVLGIPYNMDGSEGELTGEARRFLAQLQSRFRLPVHGMDERLSSREAEASLREARASGRRKRRVRREDVDAAAAKVILERWLHGEEGEREDGR